MGDNLPWYTNISAATPKVGPGTLLALALDTQSRAALGNISVFHGTGPYLRPALPRLFSTQLARPLSIGPTARGV